MYNEPASDEVTAFFGVPYTAKYHRDEFDTVHCTLTTAEEVSDRLFLRFSADVAPTGHGFADALRQLIGQVLAERTQVDLDLRARLDQLVTPLLPEGEDTVEVNCVGASSFGSSFTAILVSRLEHTSQLPSQLEATDHDTLSAAAAPAPSGRSHPGSGTATG